MAGSPIVHGVFSPLNGRMETLHRADPILDSTGSPVIIERTTSPSTGTTVVGVTQALDGSMRDQKKDLLAKANKWTTNIRERFISQRLAHQGLHSMIWPSTSYPLPVCTLTEKNATGSSDHASKLSYQNWEQTTLSNASGVTAFHRL